MSRLAKCGLPPLGSSSSSYASLIITLRTLRTLDAENDLDAWKLDRLKVLWALLALYLQAAAFVSFVGFFGVLRKKPWHVRLYRGFSAVDLAFTAFLTALAAYAAWAPGHLACEELASEPEVAQLLAPDEACERWLERAAVAFLASMLVLIVTRLHFLLAVATDYAHLVAATSSATGAGAGEGQAICLLPLPSNVPAADVVWACPAESPLRHTAAVWVRSPVAAPAPAPVLPRAADAGLLEARVVRTKRERI
ncbi:hypothetical protein DFH09DRAFT_1374625 [Mycena vulgaris]|nr:hypothetical protein DFH09DRAFT_1374625 [Mycena vulgaris]